VNFIQPSPIQQVQAFEQLNMKNPPNQSNNNKKKGKNKNNTNQGQGETLNKKTPNKGVTRIMVTKIPKGEITMANQNKGKTTTSEPISLVHYVVNMVITLTIALKF
jgi:hypothetical protein